MEVQIGNTYCITDGDGDVTTLKVISRADDNEFTCEVLASTYYHSGIIHFSQEEFDDMQDIRFIEGNKPPIEKKHTIKMNPVLKELFIDLALKTGDKKWFLELTSCKEGVC